MKGRRRKDTTMGQLPRGIRRGDYWKLVDENGEPLRSSEPSNLTGTCWMVAAPLGSERGYGLGRLEKHTVREHDDRTISVRPHDGSSNSIVIRRSSGEEFHGYIEHGVWSSC